MIGVYNNLFSRVFGFHYHSQKVIGSLGCCICSCSSWWFQPIFINISQIGNLPQVGVKIKNISNHHLVLVCWANMNQLFSVVSSRNLIRNLGPWADPCSASSQTSAGTCRFQESERSHPNDPQVNGFKKQLVGLVVMNHIS